MLPFLAEASPTLAADFHIEGLLGSPSPSTDETPSFSSFSGTFSTPGNEPASTYIGNISPDYSLRPLEGLNLNYSIDFYFPKGNIGYHVGTNPSSSKDYATETSFGTNGRTLAFGDFFTGLYLNFSDSPMSSAGLHFESGTFYFNRMLLGVSPGNQSAEVTSATITPISIPEPSASGALFFLSITFLLQRKITSRRN